MAMEFWGVEVEAGKPLKVEAEEGILVHLSLASLGEAKKDKSNEAVVLYVTVDGKKLVLGTLSNDKCPQTSYDLVFEKDFELSHNRKNGSVHFLGYKAESDESDIEDDDCGMYDTDSEEEEEEVPLAIPANGKPEPEAEKPKVVAEKAKAAKPDSSKVKSAKPDDDSEDDDSDEEDDDSKEDGSDDEDMIAGDESDDDSEDDDEESSDEEAEPSPKNAKQNKKRAAESPAKTPAEKKAKLVTPQKSGDGKKGNVHTATPHPSKGGKKADKQSPKSGNQASCKPCNKNFNSDAALQSHTKAKHSGGK